MDNFQNQQEIQPNRGPENHNNHQAESQHLAKLLIDAAQTGNPQQALEALRAERKHVLEENHGDKEASKAEMKEIRMAANHEAKRYEQQHHLPIVVFHPGENAHGRRVPGVGRMNPADHSWEEWEPRAKTWARTKTQTIRLNDYPGRGLRFEHV